MDSSQQDALTHDQMSTEEDNWWDEQRPQHVYSGNFLWKENGFACNIM